MNKKRREKKGGDGRGEGIGKKEQRRDYIGELEKRTEKIRKLERRAWTAKR